MARPTTRGSRKLLALLGALLLALSTFVPSASAASLLAIDYGTDSFKASLVKPGVPFDVLLTKEGKRKVPTLVSIRGEDRFVGGDAANLVSPNRFSPRCYWLNRLFPPCRLRVSLKTPSLPSSSSSDTLRLIFNPNSTRSSSRQHRQRHNEGHRRSRRLRRHSPSRKYSRCSSLLRRKWQRSKRTKL